MGNGKLGNSGPAPGERGGCAGRPEKRDCMLLEDVLQSLGALENPLPNPLRLPTEGTNRN